jgi:hypothetical protein
MRWSVAIGVLAGCYAPTAPSNVPCGDGDACPTGQTCVDNRCTSMPGTDVDADLNVPDTSLIDDASIDAPAAATIRFGDRGDSLPNTFFDTFLSGGTDEPDNFGAHADLHLISNDEEPILIRVDVSVIPVLATITGARLRFEVSAESIPAGRAIEVFEMNEAWDEGNRDNTEGTANHAERAENTEWSAHGAMPPSRDATAIATETIAAAIDAGGELVIDLPPQLIAGWVASPATNFGIALLVAGDGFYCELGATEGAMDRRPVLEVDLQ